MNSLDRKRGCLLGLAIGDALGAPVEFCDPGTFPPVTGFQAGGPFHLNAGEWTDDTSMALALADSIVQSGWNPDDQAQRYLNWYQTGAYSVNGRLFDIGITTRQALLTFQLTGNARTSGATSERACGNGSIMRLAPVAIAGAGDFPNRRQCLLQRAAESSVPTHAHPRCLYACQYLALVLAALINGEEREVVLSDQWSGLEMLREQGGGDAEIDRVVAGSFRHRQPPAIRGTGYVVDSLEAALWAFAQADSFESAVLAAVNLGQDSDTTGAVCGQLAGAWWGESDIPQRWRDQLAQRPLIDPLLDAICSPQLAW